jgi:tetratricopeptide (TPR) repeat protein
LPRIGLFLFLVVAIPAGAYWAGNAPASPGAALARFGRELGELRGRPAPEEASEREAQEPPTQPEPPPAPAPPPRVETRNPREAAEALYLEGRFDEAAAAFAALDPERAAEARFCAALARAFPESLPRLPYLTVTTASGVEYEGFAEEKDGNLVLVRPAGPTLSLPLQSLTKRAVRTREDFVLAAQKEARDAADAEGVEGKQLFHLLQRALVIGDRAGAARLARRALREDARTPFLLTSFRQRIADVRAREEVFQAYSACGRALPPETPPFEAAPPRGPASGPARPRAQKPVAKDPKALALVGKAKPLHEKADEIYQRVARNALFEKSEPGDLAAIEEALRLYREAMRLYADALEIEPDNALIHAPLDSASRHYAKLEMLKTQLANGK